MFIDLNELNYKKSIDINSEVLKDDKLDKRIIDLKNSHVKGQIFQNDNNDINIELVFYGDMILIDSISLEGIPYHFNIKIEEDLNSLEENYDNVYENNKNRLDLKAILWQNIVLEVPISYTECVDANLKGEGWELIKDKNEKSKDDIDPRLKKLEDLLKGDD